MKIVNFCKKTLLRTKVKLISYKFNCSKVLKSVSHLTTVSALQLFKNWGIFFYLLITNFTLGNSTLVDLTTLLYEISSVKTFFYILRGCAEIFKLRFRPPLEFRTSHQRQICSLQIYLLRFLNSSTPMGDGPYEVRKNFWM